MKNNPFRRTCRTCLTLFGLVILTSGARASRNVAEAAETVDTVIAKTGDVASGTIAAETVKGLQLKTEPCNTSNKSTIVVFSPPFRKTKIGTITCGTTVLDRYQVEKK